METAQRVQRAESEIEQCKIGVRHAKLTQKEVSELPQDTRVYRSCGRLFVLESVATVKDMQETKIKEKEEKVKALEAQNEYLKKSLKESEDSIREMLLQRQGRT